nr:ATP-binding protein [Bradyrhizobium sp. 146]
MSLPTPPSAMRYWDRINYNAHRIELKGDSLRRQAGEKKKP